LEVLVSADAVRLDRKSTGRRRLQLADMNNTEPSASDIAAFENDLKGRKVKVMLYNSQASEPTVQRLVKMAEDSKVEAAVDCGAGFRAYFGEPWVDRPCRDANGRNRAAVSR
jgi:hypothetical protein